TFRISDHLLKRVGVIHRGGKAAAVRRILASFPDRKFTLIGDSGEKDIEIYSRCYHQFPDRVSQILIRLIRPEHRFRESVIEGQLLLPPSVFKVFETPEELAEIMNVPWNPGVIASP
ncbi:MAG: App1 family protein, partial [Pirellulaceae bacterium]|nr:App1 family protein [Pirellulaceae bacterium]